MIVDTFQQNLTRGKIAETAIAKWLMARGNCVLPVYEKEIGEGKGPQFFIQQGSFAAPDMLTLPNCVWVEAKNKTVFTWHRKTQRWVTGIDLKHYRDYLQVQAHSRRPVWLLFLHTCHRPAQRDLDAGSPPVCPVGLFGHSMRFLQANINHEHPNWGRTGMVYWAHAILKLLEPLDEFYRIVEGTDNS